MFIIQKITAVRPPPGRSHGRGGRESLTAPSGCTHTQYGGHREHLEGETQPGWEGAGSVRQGYGDRGSPGRHASAAIGAEGGRGRQERGCPLPAGCAPRPRTHAHADPGRERGSGRKPQPRDPQRAKKEAVSCTSPCSAPALSSQLLLETQPSLQLPALGSCRTRRRLEPSTQLLRPRAPRAHPPPAPGARRFPSVHPLLLPHLLLSPLPPPPGPPSAPGIPAAASEWAPDAAQRWSRRMPELRA